MTSSIQPIDAVSEYESESWISGDGSEVVWSDAKSPEELWKEVNTVFQTYKKELLAGESLNTKVTRSYPASYVNEWLAKLCGELHVPLHRCTAADEESDILVNPYPLVAKAHRLSDRADVIYADVILDILGMPDFECSNSEDEDLIFERFFAEFDDWSDYISALSDAANAVYFDTDHKRQFIIRALKAHFAKLEMEKLFDLAIGQLNGEVDAEIRKFIVRVEELLQQEKQSRMESHSAVVINPSLLMKLMAKNDAITRLTVIDYFAMGSEQGINLGKMIGLIPNLRMVDLNSPIDQVCGNFFTEIGLNNLLACYGEQLLHLTDFRVNCGLMGDFDGLIHFFPKMEELTRLTLSFQPDRPSLEGADWKPWISVIKALTKVKTLEWVDLTRFEGSVKYGDEHSVILLDLLRLPDLKELYLPGWVCGQQGFDPLFARGLGSSPAIEKVIIDGEWSPPPKFENNISRPIEIESKTGTFTIANCRLTGCIFDVEKEIEFRGLISLERVHILFPRIHILSDRNGAQARKVINLCESIKQFRGAHFSIDLGHAGVLELSSKEVGYRGGKLAAFLYEALETMADANKQLKSFSFACGKKVQFPLENVVKALANRDSVRELRYSGPAAQLRSIKELSCLKKLTLKGKFTPVETKPFFRQHLDFLKVTTSEKLEPWAALTFLKEALPQSIHFSSGCEWKLENIRELNDKFDTTIFTDRSAFDRLFTGTEDRPELFVAQLPWVETAAHPQYQDYHRTLVLGSV